MGDNYWVEQAQTLSAQVAALKEAYGPAIERVKNFKKNFGIKERDNGEIIIDFDKFVQNLGIEMSLELKRVIEAKYEAPIRESA